MELHLYSPYMPSSRGHGKLYRIVIYNYYIVIVLVLVLEYVILMHYFSFAFV